MMSSQLKVTFKLPCLSMKIHLPVYSWMISKLYTRPSWSIKKFQKCSNNMNILLEIFPVTLFKPQFH